MASSSRVVGRLRFVLSVALVCSLLSPCLALSGQVSGSVAGEVVPKKSIRITAGSGVSSWKQIWEEARQEVRNGRIQKALPLYERILLLKPDLEPARWELTGLLLSTKQQARALPHLEILVERDPGNLRYLLGLVTVLQEMGNAARTIDLAGRILRLEPNNRQALSALAFGLLAQGRKAESLPLFERLLRLEPRRVDLQARLADLYAELGNDDQARRLLLALLAQKKDDQALLLKAARLHEKLGLKPQAIDLWRRLARLDPRQPEAREHLVEYFLKGGGDDAEAAPFLLAALEKDPQSLAALRRMAKITFDSGKPEVLVYLERALSLKSDDQSMLRLLASLVRSNRANIPALALFDLQLRFDPGLGQADLERGAGLYETAGRYAEAIALYDRILALTPSDLSILAKKARLLFAAGKSQLLSAFLADLASSDRLGPVLEALLAIDPGNRDALLALARLRLDRGDPAGALSLVGSNGEASGTNREVVMLKASAHEQLGNWGQALDLLERYLEEVAEDADIRFTCLRLAGALGLSARLALHCGALQSGGKLPEDPASQLVLAQAFAGGLDFVSAERFYRRLLETGVDRPELLIKASLGLADLYILRGLTYEAEQVLRMAQLPVPGPAAPPWQVAGGLIDPARLSDQELFTLLAQLVRQSPGSTAGLVADEARRRYPESLSARFWLGLIRERDGDRDGAIAVWQELVGKFPQNEILLAHLAQALFQRGRLHEVLAVLGGGGGLAEQPDMKLLAARVYWAIGERGRSLQIYESLLSPAAADEFVALAAQRGIVLPVPEAPGYIEKLFASVPVRPAAIDLVLESKKSPDAESTEAERLAVSFYARHRRQTLLRLEYAARTAQMRREYLAAAEHYRNLLPEYPGEVSLRYELAGIYSRIGQLDREGLLYEEIAMAKGDFPGLEQAVERNRLKQGPRIDLSYGYLREEGREGYKAIRLNRQSTAFQYAPVLQHRLLMELSRLNYQDPDSESRARGSRAFIAYRADVDEHLLVRGGAGLEATSGGHSDIALADLALEGRIGDRLTGSLRYGRDLKRDTLAGITRGVVQDEYRADFLLQMLPNLEIGGGYLHRDFSDHNQSWGYDLGAALVFFFEPASLRFGYDYAFRDSSEGKIDGERLTDGFAAGDHPYWSPLNSWQNRFSVAFRHQLVNDRSEGGAPRYYSLEYAAIYDEGGYASQILKGGFSIEYSSHLVFELSAGLENGPEYRARQYVLGASYRW